MSEPWFPAGDSAMAAKIRAHDWAATPLGPVETWPAPLRAAVNLMVNAPECMFMVWGEEVTFLYNDVYAPILGPRAPGALGASMRVLWGDVWDSVRGPIESAYRGQSERHVEMYIQMQRYGVPEDTWWTFSFTPIYLDDGRVGGAFCLTNEVTEKIQAERRLAREHERLAQLFEQAPMFMAFLSGPEHRIEVVNPGYLRLIDHRDVVGKTVAEALPDAVEQGYLDLLDGVYRTGEVYAANSAAYAVRAEPGGPVHPRFVDIVFQPIRDERGQITGVFVQGVDVTARIEGEAAMRALDAHSRQVIDSATDYAILATDLQGRITHWNAGAQLILGWSERQMRGHTTERLFTEQDIANGVAERELLDALETGRVVRERWQVRRSGERFWASSATTVLRNADGTAIGFVKVLGDRTAERMAIDALRDSEARLTALVSASSDALFMIDAHWTQMRQLTGTGAARDSFAPIERWMARHIPDSDQHRVVAAVHEAVTSRQPLTLEHPVRRNDGSLGWSLSRAVPLFDAEGTLHGWFGAATDITARRDAENRLRELTASLEERVRERTDELLLAEEKLRQSQKMEAVGQLTGGLAHDFNNLLTAVTMGLDLLQQRIEAGRYDRLERYLEMARSGASRAASLTQRLLAFSRRQTLAPTAVDVNQLVDGMGDILRRTLGPSIQTHFQLASPLWRVLVDAPQLENALLNLCINARDAMPEGGQLIIETHNIELDAEAAASLELAPGPYVRLGVQDTGTGMSAEVMERVFEPFFTTKPIGQGTGLGLSMIYGFMRQSGGQVRMASRLGHGTTMQLLLPRLDGAEDAIAADGVEPAALDPHTRGEVLLVEDEAPVRALIAEVLGEAGCRVTAVADGHAALEYLRGAAPIDLLLTDVGLPGGLNGRQVADAGRQLRPGLRVLFVTGYAANAAVGAGQLEAGMEVMTKPFQAAELARRVQAILAPSS